MAKLQRRNGAVSNVLRVKILDSSSTVGAGLTGLTSASSGLIISTIADNEAAATAYTVAGSTIESITTLGTFAAPTATKCRFKEVDAANHKGVYEIQIADARFAVSGAKAVIVSILGATNAAQVDLELDLQADANLVSILGTLLTETTGQIAAAFKKFFDKATPTGTINSLPDAVAGATGGLFIAGTNAATTITTALTTTFTGSLTGSVASVTAGVTLAASAVQAIWDALTSALTTAGSIGKLLVDNINATISSRLASASYTAQTGDAYARLGAPAGASVSADVAAVKVDTAAVKAKTDNLPSDPADASDIAAAIAALDDLSAAQVKAQVVAALDIDTYGAPTGVPGATVALTTKIGRMYEALIEGIDVTGSKKQFKNAAGTVIWEKDLSDDGTTYSETAGNAP